jgi:hypothetical protein
MRFLEKGVGAVQHLKYLFGKAGSLVCDYVVKFIRQSSKNKCPKINNRDKCKI